MAKKELVEQIVKLYSKLGGNMSDVLGSRSNVTFLGTGKNPEPFIDMNINIEAVGALGKSKILEELKSPMGYLTADKLNDVQATKLYNNMLKLEEFYYPKQTANITDLASGTRNLTQEGLGSLRATADDTVFGLKDYDTTGMSDVKQRIIQLEEQLGRLNADAPGFRERAKPLVDEIEALQLQLKNVDLPPPGSRGGANDIAAPIQSAEETIRQLRIQDPDLANQVRRMVDEGIISTVGNKGGNPAKRASAREFLVEALKADDTFATKLGTIVDAQDVKFITEGGGGVAGDPLRLVEKYFGPRILEALPAGATGEDIITFTRRVMDNVEDAKGLKPDDPRFDRFTAQFVDEMAKGGRAGFRLGKNVFKGIAELFKKGGDDVDLIKQEKTFREGPITMKFLDEVDRGMANKFIRTRDMKGPQGYGLYESMADMPKGLQAAEFIKNIRGPRGNVDYERAEMYIGGGVKLTGKETVDELIEMFLNAVKQPLAKGGLAKILEV
tara:strand:- start:1592 stop:3088 length:1497 start_codon:yes stop_codon:yes gene_type:complete